MQIVEKIRQDWMTARKARNSELASQLGTLYSAIQNVGLNDGKRETTNEEALRVIKKFKEGVEDILKYQDSEEKRAELAVYVGYLPAMLSDDELRLNIVAIIDEVGKSSKAIGEVQKRLTSQFGSQGYDKKRASEIVKELIE